MLGRQVVAISSLCEAITLVVRWETQILIQISTLDLGQTGLVRIRAEQAWARAQHSVVQLAASLKSVPLKWREDADLADLPPEALATTAEACTKIGRPALVVSRDSQAPLLQALASTTSWTMS